MKITDILKHPFSFFCCKGFFSVFGDSVSVVVFFPASFFSLSFLFVFVCFFFLFANDYKILSFYMKQKIIERCLAHLEMFGCAEQCPEVWTMD